MRFEVSAEREPAFPAICHCCGRAPDLERTINVSRLVARGQKQEPVERKYAIPLCKRCGRADDRVGILSWGSALLGAVLITIATFIGLLALQPVLHRAGINLGYGEVISERGNGLIILGAVAFIVGVLGGGLVEALVKVLAIPFLGRALYWAPFLLRQVFGDVSYVAGLTGALSQDGRQVRFRFFNPAVGRAFAQENNLKATDD